MRNFQAKPAAVQAQKLIIGLAGASGSGKTYSALRLATGICQADGVDPATGLFLIDTENGRALHYAEWFKFQHVAFAPPFGALDYVAAIDFALKSGARVIVIDSMSHEHEGEGGMIDQHAKRVEEKGQGHNMLAWQKPKAERRKLLSRITQCGAHLILCYRAKDTAKPDPKATGPEKVKQLGYTAITGEEFIFEATLSTILRPNSGGVPTWASDLEGERKSIKVARQFGWVRDLPGPLTEETGRRLGEWAAGAPRESDDEALARFVAEIDAIDDVDQLRKWLATNKPAMRAALSPPSFAMAEAHCIKRGKQLAAPADRREEVGA